MEENRIAINSGMSEIQNVKTAIHEMAHAKLHNSEAQKTISSPRAVKRLKLRALLIPYASTTALIPLITVLPMLQPGLREKSFRN